LLSSLAQPEDEIIVVAMVALLLSFATLLVISVPEQRGSC
jgi:hypothetical protein